MLALLGCHARIVGAPSDSDGKPRPPHPLRSGTEAVARCAVSRLPHISGATRHLTFTHQRVSSATVLCMRGDSAVEALLGEVIEDWHDRGPLVDLLDTVETVWKTNLERHEPEALGDDATSLGMQCSRNILHRAEARLRARDIEGVRVRGGQTLEVEFAGRVMHTSKVRARNQSWDPYSIDWSASEVRTEGAAANSRVYTPVAGTVFEYLPECVGALPGGGDLSALRYLHLSWQGLSEGHVRIFAGFPSAGTTPWMAVRLIKDTRPGGGGLPLITDGTPFTPDHDAMSEPSLVLKRRPRPITAEGARDSA